MGRHAREAVIALGTLKATAASDAVRLALATRDPAVRRTAAWALEQIQDKR
jgi:HEAT repeat protein